MLFRSVKGISWSKNFKVRVPGFFALDGTKGLTLEEAYFGDEVSKDGVTGTDEILVGKDIAAWAIVPFTKTDRTTTVWRIVFKDNEGTIYFQSGNAASSESSWNKFGGITYTFEP